MTNPKINPPVRPTRLPSDNGSVKGGYIPPTNVLPPPPKAPPKKK